MGSPVKSRREECISLSKAHDRNAETQQFSQTLTDYQNIESQYYPDID
jgi:hypothetical protein